MKISHRLISSLIAIGFLVVPTLLWAQPGGGAPWARGDKNFKMLSDSLQKISAEFSDKQLSTLTGADLSNLLGQISVARQQYAWVRRSELASAMAPGAGQFMNGDALGGSLFLGGQLLITAGTVLGSYFLLPAKLRFGQTDYFHDSFATIKANWESENLVSLLPSTAMLIGGAIIDHIYRHIAAANAGKLARENIRSGKVSFRPEPLLLFEGPGRPFFGLGFGMRY